MSAVSDFSLFDGGPLYQLWRRTRLVDPELRLFPRRIAAFVTLTWIPLLLASISARQAWGNGVELPFVNDIELHARFLVAMPLLILAEVFVHRRMRPLVLAFLERRLIREEDQPKFLAAVDSAKRLRNSISVEIVFLAFVYLFGVGVLWRTQIALDVRAWHGAMVDGIWQPSAAGWWLGCVSLPVFQFLLLRWYFRLFVWARFLWQVSRLDLNLAPAHPDRAGGLGFLAAVDVTFAPVLLAQGALLSGMMANRILYGGAKLPDFKSELVGLVAFLVFAVLGPLLVFMRQLEAKKRRGMFEHGGLAQRYVSEYERKWLHGGAPAEEQLIGSGDIQSLADLGNSYAAVQEMRLVPFGWKDVTRLAAATALPLLPLTLTIFSLEELATRLLKVLL
jgi:hypothetical protein